jgi:hypothetical protein
MHDFFQIFSQSLNLALDRMSHGDMQCMSPDLTPSSPTPHTPFEGGARHSLPSSSIPKSGVIKFQLTACDKMPCGGEGCRRPAMRSRGLNRGAKAPLVAAGGALTLSRCRHGEMVATFDSRAGINPCISLEERLLLCDVSQLRPRQPILARSFISMIIRYQIWIISWNGCRITFISVFFSVYLHG